MLEWERSAGGMIVTLNEFVGKKNMFQCQFVHHTFHVDLPKINPAIRDQMSVTKSCHNL
jgi:hypothetical protein